MNHFPVDGKSTRPQKKRKYGTRECGNETDADAYVLRVRIQAREREIRKCRIGSGLVWPTACVLHTVFYLFSPLCLPRPTVAVYPSRRGDEYTGKFQSRKLRAGRGEYNNSLKAVHFPRRQTRQNLFKKRTSQNKLMNS